MISNIDYTLLGRINKYLEKEFPDYKIERITEPEISMDHVELIIKMTQGSYSRSRLVEIPLSELTPK